VAPRCHAGSATQTDLLRKEVQGSAMKRPNLEIRAMRTMRGICLLAETLTATYLDDQCQRAGCADSALLSGDSCSYRQSY
jgi:hypothetical protein